ncbi:MAG: hypothetical protein O3B73_17260, partial [bacterium]|nr:hypothetical protein [bacterium]
MAYDVSGAFQAGHTLAVADHVLINPQQGTLVKRVTDLLHAVQGTGASAPVISKTLIQLGMNFAGRDAEIVGYGAAEIDAAFNQVLSAIDGLEKSAVSATVAEFLADMKSVNMADSLSGLLAERIEPKLDARNPGRSFLELLKSNMRNGVYWEMIGSHMCKFGNDFARGLEYLRHYGFCQVSTNPVLAAKAFDEDPSLDDVLKAEVVKHPAWKSSPDAHADEIVMAATLIALWPNLAIFRPLAIHTALKDYMVSFQLNPNIADQAGASVEDAHNAYGIADDFLKGYDKFLGAEGVVLDPNIVFKVGGGHEAARKITTVLNSEGIGTNNTVVYTVAQEVQLVIDAFEGKAKAAKAGKPVVRTYETNMGGRFVSHLREVEAEKLFTALPAEKAEALLVELASSLGISLPQGSVAKKANAACSYAKLKSLDHPVVLKAAAVGGKSAESIRQLEADLKMGGTLVARRVHWVYYAAQNR